MLAVLPARPVIYIVPVVVVLVMSFYYWNLYTDCMADKQRRMELGKVLKSVDRPDRFRLADFTDFAWDLVRVVVNFKPERRNLSCPFGWG